MITIKSNIDLEKLLAKEMKSKTAVVLRKAMADLVAATPIDTGHARESWSVEGDSIVNTADYIEHLNAGSSKQAPLHFIERTLLSQEGIFPSGTIVRSK